MDRVLVVDDSLLVCAMLTGWLESAGHEVATATTAAEALRAVAERPPALILLDLVLPDQSGVEVCRALKADDATARIPIVVLTGEGTSENRIACLEQGAEDFLTKPVVHEELLARVRSLLRAKHLSDRLLISFLELDKLGTFAETFTSQAVADWSAVEVAASMARHLLGSSGDTAGHPQVVWAGHRVHTRMMGVAWYFQRGEWHGETSSFPAERLAEALRPFDRGGGQYVGKRPMPDDLRALLGLLATPPPANFVGLVGTDVAIVAGGYPWEVGAYELPLLRAVLRHWAVFERIRYEARQAEQAFFCTMEALALAAEFYDDETASHIRRLTAYARLLARRLGHGEPFVKWISKSAPMHDIGKITVPIELVRKPDVLTPAERAALERHTTNGARLLGNLPPLAMARAVARSHHESFDGSGYPDGTRGDEIPVEARIVKVVDVYDALRTLRPYKRAYTHQEAIALLRHGDGRVQPSHFDPIILGAFLDCQADIARIHAGATSDDDPRAAVPETLIT